jgi:hypothetical protein
VRNEVSAIESSHRVTDEVYPSTDRLALEKIVERLSSGRDGAGATYHC